MSDSFLPKSSTSFPLLAALYTVVIFGVMYWSGVSVERSLFDTARISGSAVMFPVKDRQVAARFYREVLQFDIIGSTEQNEPIGATLAPDPTIIFTSDAIGPAAAAVRLKGRLASLHAALRGRLTMSAIGTALSPGGITPVYETASGTEFVVSDLEGNRIIFFQPKRRSSWQR